MNEIKDKKVTLHEFYMDRMDSYRDTLVWVLRKNM